MTWDQMKDEIKNVVRLFDEVYSLFELPYEIELSTMPEDHMGDEKDWEFAQETLKEAITEMGKSYVMPSTAPSWTSISRTLWAGPGSAAPSSWICSCLSASSWSTPGPTARSTAP